MILSCRQGHLPEFHSLCQTAVTWLKIDYVTGAVLTRNEIISIQMAGFFL